MPKSEQELRATVAKNIADFRKSAGLTQSELAEKINYSDKSVSKWERGEGLPDVYVLSQIADICSVNAGDFFLDEPKKLKSTVKRVSTKVRLVITALAVGLVLLFATIVYLVFSLVKLPAQFLGLAYFCAIPVSAIVLIVFTAIWFKRIWSFLSVSLLIWSVAFGLWYYIQAQGILYIFAVAAALEVLVVLWYLLLWFRSRDKKSQN
ncbi:MAG: helix-turn-helix transcriptional regulator [Oscillospiraceae bacterium]|nr:helix-turn-helix transcriptional regulator [Oscillospiraceae bacterium]